MCFHAESNRASYLAPVRSTAKKIAFLSLLCFPTYAGDQQVSSSIQDGGSVLIATNYGRVINEGSTLRRSWITLNDSTCPLELSNVGITTAKFDEFQGVGSAKTKEPITAFEIRFLLFDIFGEHLTALRLREVVDLAQSDEYELGGEQATWNARYGDAKHLLTVVAFVATVRKADGSVWRFSQTGISSQLQRVTSLRPKLSALQEQSDD